jgi:hypothetical protein
MRLFGQSLPRTRVNKDEGTCTRPEPGADQGGEHGYGKPSPSARTTRCKTS